MEAHPDTIEHRTTTFLRNYQGEGTLYDAPVTGAQSFFVLAASNNDFTRISLDLVIDPDGAEQLLPNAGPEQ